jgi:glycogen debranching enzyme
MSPQIEALLSDEGWAYASAPAVEPGDPGRFHALFGRDSLITALQVLPDRPGIARATLRALAARQGRVEDPETGEQPGKILHEYRPLAPPGLVARGWPVRDDGLLYFGSADSTAWFLVVLAATQDRTLADELGGAWRAAGDWLARALDAGDGLVRGWLHPGAGGLTQQGWRDADDPLRALGAGILRVDGSVPRGPLADMDVQAVAYAAMCALASLDPGRASSWRQRAHAMRARLSETFDSGVLAIEADGALVQGAGSQLGWLLWAGALDRTAAHAAAERLIEPDLLTAFGLRTLASTHPQFRPDAYHRGGVWPFDSWLGWGGLRALGYVDAAERIRAGVLAAVKQLGRAPELYAVSASGELARIPIANRVQAWTVGAAWALAAGWDGRTGWPARG